MADTRFILVATLRTGSTLLIGLLTSHDDIFCDNELFNHHEICRYRYNEGDIQGLEYRNTNPKRFWDEFFYSEFAEQQKVIGFNLVMLVLAPQLCFQTEIKFVYGLATRIWKTGGL